MRNKCLLNLLTIYGLITALSVTNGEFFTSFLFSKSMENATIYLFFVVSLIFLKSFSSLNLESCKAF